MEELPGFSLYDLSGLNPNRANEEEEAGQVEEDDNAAIFAIAMERMLAGEQQQRQQLHLVYIRLYWQ